MWGRGDRAAGAGAEERALGAMRGSRGDSVSGGAGAVGVAGVAGGGVGGGASGGVGAWGVAEAVGAGDEERALGAMRRSRDDGVLVGVRAVRRAWCGGVVGCVVVGRQALATGREC